jgi:hypothetical protein
LTVCAKICATAAAWSVTTEMKRLSGITVSHYSSASSNLGTRHGNGWLNSASLGLKQELQGKIGCGMLERFENLDFVVVAVGLEVLRQQVPGAGTLGSGRDEGVPIGELRGIHPMPGLLDQADSGVHGFQCAKSSTISRARASSRRIFLTAYQ